MENFAVFSHYLAFDRVVNVIEQEIPMAKFDVPGDGKSLTATIPGGLFGKSKTLKINYRQRLNPSYKLDQPECAVTKNLAGMVGFIQRLPTSNNEVKSKLLYKTMAVNAEIAFMADPEFTPEMVFALKKILIDLDAFAFTPSNKVFNRSAGQHFVDKNMKVILDVTGLCEVSDLEVTVEAKYHDQPANGYSQEQLDRKAASEKILSSHGIKVNKNLPCTPDSKDVKLRSINEVIDRSYALMTLAAKGEGVEQEALDRVIAEKKINSFSPEEQLLINTGELSDEQRTHATWRYESLYVMLWALSKTEDLKFPSNICDVAALVGSIIKPSRQEFANSVKLKSSIDILDELDKIYRMNWACVDARIKGEQPGGNIHGGIVYERHYSLNWLTSYQNQEWDDLQTNT